MGSVAYHLIRAKPGGIVSANAWHGAGDWVSSVALRGLAYGLILLAELYL